MIAYLDLAGGLSGDIFLSCCLAAGADQDQLIAELKKLPLGGWEFKRETVMIHGIACQRIKFVVESDPPHRHWSHIRDKIIGPAELPERAKARALSAFEALAKAEAKVHDSTPDHVHFHEVGADDSILDIVGAALALELLEVDELVASPVPLCRGRSACQHGDMPLPPPAVVELLKGKPVFGCGSETEMITPTGAALLTWAEQHGDLPAMELASVGGGVGQRENGGVPTRIFIGAPEAAALPGDGMPVTILTTSIDDMSPELLAPLLDRLLKSGAADVTFAPVQMKKNRPAVRLEVICAPAATDRLIGMILEETTSLGVRVRREERRCLGRETGQVEVMGVQVGGKWTVRPSGRKDFRPEFDSCKDVAAVTGLPVSRVFELALAAAHKS